MLVKMGVDVNALVLAPNMSYDEWDKIYFNFFAKCLLRWCMLLCIYLFQFFFIMVDRLD